MENRTKTDNRRNKGILKLFLFFFNWLPYDLVIILVFADNSSLDMSNQAKLLIKVSFLTFNDPDIRKHLTDVVVMHSSFKSVSLTIYEQQPDAKNE